MSNNTTPTQSHHKAPGAVENTSSNSATNHDQADMLTRAQAGDHQAFAQPYSVQRVMSTPCACAW
jgi:hypothetical protein